jgi:hydroxymethylpyrimidine/phosphomethylpyrimidine kinase
MLARLYASRILADRKGTNMYPAAIACNIANGLSMERAVRAAGRYVEAGIKTSVDLGKGSGPINHFHSLNIMPFPP